MPQSRSLRIRGISIILEHPVVEFTTPDWAHVMACYRGWRCTAEDLEMEVRFAAPVQFMDSAFVELVRLEIRPGRTANTWARRMMQHFGFAWWAEQMTQMNVIHDELVAARAAKEEN